MNKNMFVFKLYNNKSENLTKFSNGFLRHVKSHINITIK